jgi:gas vesicle protein
MSDSKFIAGVLFGAVAGTALVLFLSSEKGKAFIKDLKEGQLTCRAILVI